MSEVKGSLSVLVSLTEAAAFIESLGKLTFLPDSGKPLGGPHGSRRRSQLLSHPLAYHLLDISTMLGAETQAKGIGGLHSQLLNTFDPVQSRDS